MNMDDIWCNLYTYYCILEKNINILLDSVINTGTQTYASPK